MALLLRHTFASWLTEEGARLGEVATMLSHATLQTTRRYARLAAGQTADRMASRLDALAADMEVAA
jgi:site-specific recombinase XerD